MATIVEELIASTQKPAKRRKPATAAQIKALEAAWGRKLPPSYRAFLEVTNGLDGEGFTHRLIGTEDQKWAKKQVAEVSEFWDDFDPSKVFPVAVPDAGDGIHNLAAFAKGKGEELPVVDWDHGSELQRFSSFAAYLEDEINVQLAVAKSEEKEAKKAKATAKKLEGGRETLKTAAIPKSGPAREAAFEAVFTLEDPKAIASAVEQLIAAKPTADELAKFMETLHVEISGASTADFARAELIFHPQLKVPAAAREEWTRLANDAISRVYSTKDKKRSERWSDVAAPFVRKNAYLGHNLACAYVQVGRIDDAFDMCKAAIEIGYPRTSDMRVDKDLGALLKQDRFQKLFGAPDKTDAKARTSIPRNAALEADLIAGKAPAKLGAWLTKEGSALGAVVEADVAADKSGPAKRKAKALFESYRKDVFAKAFPLLASYFKHHLDGRYFTFHYGFLEKLDSFELNTAKERAEVLAFLGDPHATFVKYLTLRGAKLGDLSLYQRLPALRRIQHRWTDITQVTSLEPLAGLTQLRALDLAKSKVTDLRPLAKLPLIQLYLDSSTVTDLSPLAKHPTLSHLTLNNTKVKDISPLLTCPKLSAVSLYEAKVEKAQIDKLAASVKKAKPNYDDATMDGYDAGIFS